MFFCFENEKLEMVDGLITSLLGRKSLDVGVPQHSTGRADVQLFTGKTASSSMNEQLLYLNELRPAFAASG